ncbi:prolyl oligopeptidase family serine peptidase [Pseudoalteromonas piscicida]|uniref:S9 family peptidase n=1 Tax=Pseudoalteromonas piscicida TaxID=43662 RepID=UPI001EFD0016|nr:prolyl oligopeptidase family serine peptidase [Pseudoalteromonas piscicida]MCG9771529.1 prolyl oligopeptidase family serine peptidase [Pseudoalteromonas piscicida]
MLKLSLISMAVASGLFLSGCQTTEVSPKPQQVEANSPVPQVVATPVDFGGEQITLKQAMAHPDWLGRQSEGAYWGADSKTVFYKRKQAGSELRDLFKVSSAQTSEAVSLSDLHAVGAANAIYNKGRTLQSYEFKGNIFVKNLKSGALTQVTHSSNYEYAPQFLSDNRLAYRSGNALFAFDIATGLTKELVKLHLADKPEGVKEPNGYIAEQQHKLIQFVALTHKNSKDREARNQEIEANNASIQDNQFYLGKGKTLISVSLAPTGDKLIAVITDDKPSRSDSDIMPNYVSQNGDIDPVKARRRVADTKPMSSDVIFIDLAKSEQVTLSYDTLPGFDEDVLAEVKRENAKAKGESYKSEKAPRDINLIDTWGWSQSAIQWNSDGSQVAVMLGAWDNKDRWLATVDFDKQQFVSQHRLHDNAWINYTYNDFGWLSNQDALYYLSEQTGYSQLYVKPLNGKAKAMTSGKFVVSEPTLTQDSQFVYYKANKDHPGLYEIYRVNLASGEDEQLTDLDGLTDYQLSPDEQKLLLTHSKIMMPPELYVADAAPKAAVSRLTNTVSDAFLNKKLIAPKIVAVPSSHQGEPVYAKVYYPADYQEGETGKNRKAVIFNHGAGYLQNSHMGWSNYFREFMFHSLLASEGYVVMDMDYRGSKGYGRDWRTAIYRHMGKPEIEDLADGVEWMVNNANVDRGAVGTYGGSYGGFMTFMALFTQPDLFQAGAALRPVTDWAYYNDPYTSNILNRPDVDPIAYKRSSPIYHAEGLKNKLLINAPMVDDNVFFQDVVRLVQRLIELEKEDFETAIYPVEPHGFRQPSSWLDEYRRIYKLFKENL